MNTHLFYSTFTGCVSVSAFAFLVGIPVSIASSAVGSKIYVITSGIKKYKFVIKKKKKKHDKIVILARARLSSIEVLISKTLINPNLSYE